MPRTKQELREAARSRRLRLSPEEIRSQSRSICNLVLMLLDGQDPVMVYASKPPEVQTDLLIEGLLSRRKGVVVPIIEQETRSLRLSYLTDPSCLVRSTFSVPEPIGNERPARPEEIRAVVIPMIAFDSTGHRLGYGAGYYDRFLKHHPGVVKIGVAFSCQEVDKIPADENDVSMDLIVTEKGIVRCSPHT
jgi:5-formyltetrahydrofolate cyclo-ligase